MSAVTFRWWRVILCATQPESIYSAESDSFLKMSVFGDFILFYDLNTNRLILSPLCASLWVANQLDDFRLMTFSINTILVPLHLLQWTWGEVV